MQITEIGALIASASPEDIAALDPRAMEGLSEAVAPTLPPALIKVSSGYD